MSLGRVNLMDNKPNPDGISHAKAILYHKARMEKFGDNVNDRFEILNHRFIINPDDIDLNELSEIGFKATPSDKCYKKIILLGEYYLNSLKSIERARIHFLLGYLYLNRNRFFDCYKNYQEALKFYRKLAQKDPGTYLPEVAITLNNLGILHRNLKEFDDAKKSYDEALGIYRKLAEKEPVLYDEEVKEIEDKLKNLKMNQK